MWADVSGNFAVAFPIQEGILSQVGVGQGNQTVDDGTGRAIENQVRKRIGLLSNCPRFYCQISSVHRHVHMETRDQVYGFRDDGPTR